MADSDKGVEERRDHRATFGWALRFYRDEHLPPTGSAYELFGEMADALDADLAALAASDQRVKAMRVALGRIDQIANVTYESAAEMANAVDAIAEVVDSTLRGSSE